MAEEQGARMVRGRYRPVLCRNELVSKFKGIDTRVELASNKGSMMEDVKYNDEREKTLV